MVCTRIVYIKKILRLLALVILLINIFHFATFWVYFAFTLVEILLFGLLLGCICFYCFDDCKDNKVTIEVF